MMNWLYLATGFTGAWTLHFLWQQVGRLFFTPPLVDVHISNGADCLDLLLAALKRARREVLVLARTLHAPPVAMALVAAKLRKVQVEILLDPACERDQASDLPTLQEQGLQPLTSAPDAISMGAVIVIDGREVFCGGFTSGAEVGPEATVDLLHFKGHPEIVLAYRQHFTNEKLNARPAAIQPKAPHPASVPFKGYNTPGSTSSPSTPTPPATSEGGVGGARQFPSVHAGRTMPGSRSGAERLPAGTEASIEREAQSAMATVTPPSRSAPQTLEPSSAAGALSTSTFPVRQPRPASSVERTVQAAAATVRPENAPSDEPSQAVERPTSPMERTIQAAATLGRQSSQPVAPQEKKTPAPTPLPPRDQSPGTTPAVAVPPPPATPVTDRETALADDSTISKTAETPPAPSAPKSTATTTPAAGALSSKPTDNSNLTPLQRKLAALGVNIANNPGGV